MNNHTSSLESPHFPVMLNEVLHISSPSNGGRYIDCTFGGGGYCKEILKYPKTNVQALDRDKKALLAANKLEKRFPNRFKFNQIKFSQLDTISCNNLDVAIFDLGLSSIQLDDLERGFSFKSRKKLNMTMGLNEISALDSVKYVISQIVGSTLAALSIYLMNTSMQVQPVLGDSVYPIFFSEIIFTFLLVFVILNVATHPNLKGNSFYGLAIGLTVMTGIFSVGPISGAVFNPAVSLGPSIIDLITSEGVSHYFTWYYIVFPLIGSILAVLGFKFLVSSK